MQSPKRACVHSNVGVRTLSLTGEKLQPECETSMLDEPSSERGFASDPPDSTQADFVSQPLNNTASVGEASTGKFSSADRNETPSTSTENKTNINQFPFNTSNFLWHKETACDPETVLLLCSSVTLLTAFRLSWLLFSEPGVWIGRRCCTCTSNGGAAHAVSGHATQQL